MRARVHGCSGGDERDIGIVLLHCGTFPLPAPYAAMCTWQGKGSQACDSGAPRHPRVRPTAVRFGFHSHASWACLGSFVGGGGGCVRAETGRRCRRLSETRAAKAEGRATAVCASWARRRISHAMRAVKI